MSLLNVMEKATSMNMHTNICKIILAGEAWWRNPKRENIAKVIVHDIEASLYNSENT